MSRYIDANKLKESIRKLRRCMQLMDNSKRADIVMQGISLAEIEIEKIPSADVAPVVHSKWCMSNDPLRISQYQWYCSNCHSEELYEYNYCPNCGAKMDGEHGKKN